MTAVLAVLFTMYVVGTAIGSMTEPKKQKVGDTYFYVNGDEQWAQCWQFWSLSISWGRSSGLEAKGRAMPLMMTTWDRSNANQRSQIPLGSVGVLTFVVAFVLLNAIFLGFAFC
jgi:hypothetical protein